MLVMKLNEVIAFLLRGPRLNLSLMALVFSLLSGKEVTVFVNMLVPYSMFIWSKT